MKPKKIYIAGPMTGLPDHNYPAFDAAAERIRAYGNIPINPAEMNRTHFGGRTDLPWHYYIGHDMAHVALYADEVQLLPGWHESKGARIEYIIAAARRLGITMPKAWTMHGDDIEEGLRVVRELGDIVQEARNKVYGDRNVDYGHPDEDFKRTSEIVEHSMELLLRPEDVPQFMMAVKLSRYCHKPKRDNLVDLAGYVMTLYFDELKPKGGEQ